jgi:mono/diheme cytochrome c family protein
MGNPVSHFARWGFRIVLLATCVSAIEFGEAAPPAAATYDNAARPFLEAYCFSCHGPDTQKSKVRFDQFTGLTLEDAELWRLAMESVEFGEMPPKGEPKPTDDERAAFVSWVKAQLNAPQLAADAQLALHSPAEGNRVDHEKLFDGSITGPAWSPPRMWRRSQSQYDAIMEEMWVLPRLRNDYALQRDDPRMVGYGYAQPFPQMDPKQFTNYAGGVHADDTTLKALMDAGYQVAKRLTDDKPKFHPLTQPVVQIGYPHARPNGELGAFYIEPPQRADVFEPFMKDNAAPSEADRHAAIDHVFRLLHDRSPSENELKRYDGLLASNIDKAGPVEAVRGLITAVVVSPEFVFRMEVGMSEPDAHGRRMLAPRELMYAIAYALTDAGPDEQLVEAAESGRLKTRADVEREVRRIVEDPAIEKLPLLRFWQEFFGYVNAEDVFKEQNPYGTPHRPNYLIRDADQLVTHILKQDRQVFRELLTTERYFVGWPTAGGDDELRQKWIDEAKTNALESIEKSRQRAEAKGKAFEIKPPSRFNYSDQWLVTQGKTIMPKARHNDEGNRSRQYAFVYGFDPKTMGWSPSQPMQIPDPRMGMLMHPAWLIAHSKNFDNDIVGRGHWVRERLLAGTMPSIPIDVEAQVPESETKTLRQRMQVTRDEYCWKCHKRMDPLGLPFESYDHFGWHRTEEYTDEARRNKQPVDETGGITFSGEPALDGPVEDARELVTKLAGSERVRQSIIRHAFRFWMGRNEMLSDSPTLVAADRAYVDSDGSFNEMVVALLTSDSFLYRK